MPSRSRGSAVNELKELLQEGVSCISRAVVIHRSDEQTDLVQVLALSQGSARLQGASHLSIQMEFFFRIAEIPDARGWWGPRPLGYSYKVVNAAKRELFAYHYHPHGQSHVTFPHIHFGHDVGNIPEVLKEAHFPTGPVTLAEVVRLLINDFDVRPRRPDWPAVLDRAQTALATLHQ